MQERPGHAFTTLGKKILQTKTTHTKQELTSNVQRMAVIQHHNIKSLEVEEARRSRLQNKTLVQQLQENCNLGRHCEQISIFKQKAYR